MELEYDEYDLDAWHDCIANVVSSLGLVEPSCDAYDWEESRLLKVYNYLPGHIQFIALQHGLSDTCFRDEAYEWLRDNWEYISLPQILDNSIDKSE